MPLARWQATIVDEAGNIIPSASIEVRREIAGAPLASLYSDRDGSSAIGNPFQADAEGFAAFHVAGGAYKITASATGFSRIWRYAGIGTGAETDLSLFVPSGAWDIATTYETGDLVSHDDGGEPYSFVSNVDSNLANEPQFGSGIGISDASWTVVGLGETGLPGSSDVVGSSVSSVSIGTGTKTFAVVESNRGWGVGARLRVTSAANPTTHWMEGVITAYAANTLQITSDLVAGSGSRADWTINLAGQPPSAWVANGQLAFPATQNPSADPNTLDDYEEGTWTPGFSANASAAGVTYSIQAGNYVKIGKMVFASGQLTLTSNGTGVGTARLTGLPFSAAHARAVGSGNLIAGGSAATGIYPRTEGGTTLFLQIPGAAAAAFATDTNCTDTFSFIFSIAYES